MAPLPKVTGHFLTNELTRNKSGTIQIGENTQVAPRHIENYDWDIQDVTPPFILWSVSLDREFGNSSEVGESLKSLKFGVFRGVFPMDPMKIEINKLWLDPKEFIGKDFWVAILCIPSLTIARGVLDAEVYGKKLPNIYFAGDVNEKYNVQLHRGVTQIQGNLNITKQQFKSVGLEKYRARESRFLQDETRRLRDALAQLLDVPKQVADLASKIEFVSAVIDGVRENLGERIYVLEKKATDTEFLLGLLEPQVNKELEKLMSTPSQKITRAVALYLLRACGGDLLGDQFDFRIPGI